MINPYRVLGISENANVQQIKKAYKRLAKQYHPDKNKEDTSELFKQINQAYDLCMQPKEPKMDIFHTNPFNAFKTMYYSSYIHQQTIIRNGRKIVITEYIHKNGD